MILTQPSTGRDYRTGRIRSIRTFPDSFNYPDYESESLVADETVKEDETGYRNDDYKGLNEKTGVIHDNSGLLWIFFLRILHAHCCIADARYPYFHFSPGSIIPVSGTK